MKVTFLLSVHTPEEIIAFFDSWSTKFNRLGFQDYLRWRYDLPENFEKFSLDYALNYSLNLKKVVKDLECYMPNDDQNQFCQEMLEELDELPQDIL